MPLPVKPSIWSCFATESFQVIGSICLCRTMEPELTLKINAYSNLTHDAWTQLASCMKSQNHDHAIQFDIFWQYIRLARLVLQIFSLPFLKQPWYLNMIPISECAERGEQRFVNKWMLQTSFCLAPFILHCGRFENIGCVCRATLAPARSMVN